MTTTTGPLPDAECAAIADLLAFYADELRDEVHHPNTVAAGFLDRWRERAAAGDSPMGRDALTLGQVREGRYFRPEPRR